MVQACCLMSGWTVPNDFTTTAGTVYYDRQSNVDGRREAWQATVRQ